MKPTINLYVDFEFTSLSPDAQIVSLGIVSDEKRYDNCLIHPVEFEKLDLDKSKYILTPDGYTGKHIIESKFFYSEFTDFDINRCDDWVKENVIKKLILFKVSKDLNTSFDETVLAAKKSTNWSKEYSNINSDPNCFQCVGNTWRIKEQLKEWLSQFSDYNIQFVVDCGTWDFYHLLQLIAEWDVQKEDVTFDAIGDGGGDIFEAHKKQLEILVKAKGRELVRYISKFDGIGIREHGIYIISKTGLPKLPENISPIPFDLNDLIAIKKGISPKEAFELNREELVCNAENSLMKEKKISDFRYMFGKEWGNEQNNVKHNALWDAKVIKAIYNKLK